VRVRSPSRAVRVVRVSLEPTGTRSPRSCSATATGRGDDWADIIDMLTMHPEIRRRAARVLAEIDAGNALED
jgi:hypothetical protein